jgi:RNA polymerase sigma factor (TIGR02999 family)
MEITELLHRIGEGDRAALDAVIPLVYEELKRVASARLRREAGGQPLETTALVHEAYLKLAGGKHPEYENRSHFYGVASRLMRQILVDAARARSAGKREGREVCLTEIPDFGPQPDEALLRMEDALEKLNRTDPVKVRLIEMRFFGGMTAEETAEALGMSVHMVRKDLRMAQAWLRKEMAG